MSGSHDPDPDRHARRERLALIRERQSRISTEANERMRVWQEHRAQVAEVGRAAGGKRQMALRCAECPRTDRGDGIHAEIVNTRMGPMMRTIGMPTWVADPDTGERMTLQEIKAWEQQNGLGLPRTQVEAWLLDDPTPLPPDAPAIVCKVHGRIPVDAHRVQHLLGEKVRRVRVAADGTPAAE